MRQCGEVTSTLVLHGFLSHVGQLHEPDFAVTARHQYHEDETGAEVLALADWTDYYNYGTTVVRRFNKDR
jgi:hypothetical protein